MQSTRFFDRSNWRQWLKAAVLVVATLLVYLPAIGGGFIWDDDHFAASPLFKAGPGSLWLFWFSPPTPDYFPLTSTSFWAEHFFFGAGPFLYHFDNVVLHIAVALMLWRVFQLLEIPGAWLGALIFALHPVNAASAAWIAERKNVLSGVFYLGAILAWLRFERLKRWRWYMVALACFILGLLSKTSVAVLPLMLVLYAWWREGRISRQTVLRTLPFFGLAVVFGVVTIVYQHMQWYGTNPPAADGIWVRLVGAGWVTWFYLGKFFWPFNEMMIYPKWEVDATLPTSYVPDLALVALFFVAWRYRNRGARPLLFALLYFVTALLPVMGLINMNFLRISRVSDHLVYIPLMGMAGLVGGMTSRWLRPAPQKNRARHFSFLGIARYALPVLVIFILMARTTQRSGVFGNEMWLWVENIEKNPESWAPYGNLGSYFAREGRHKDAIPLYQTALDRNPAAPLMHNNLGESYYKLEQIDTAIAEYTLALQQSPNYAEPHNNMGVALAMRGRLNEALVQYQKAIEMDPYHILGANNYGQALIQGGRAPEAEVFLRRMLKQFPDDAGMEAGLGLALAVEGKTGEAIGHYARALRIEPNDTQTRNNMGAALIQVDRLPEAEEQFRAALKIAPRDVDLRNNLALVLIKENRTPEAIDEYRKLIKLNPEDPSGYNTLARLLATSRIAACRNGGEAIKLAETACRLTERKNPLALDTAAAAYAETGHFKEAVTFERSARDLAVTSGQPNLVAEIEQRLKVYEAGQPLRE